MYNGYSTRKHSKMYASALLMPLPNTKCESRVGEKSVQASNAQSLLRGIDIFPRTATLGALMELAYSTQPGIQTMPSTYPIPFSTISFISEEILRPQPVAPQPQHPQVYALPYAALKRCSCVVRQRKRTHQHVGSYPRDYHRALCQRTALG